MCKFPGKTNERQPKRSIEIWKHFNSVWEHFHFWTKLNQQNEANFYKFYRFSLVCGVVCTTVCRYISIREKMKVFVLLFTIPFRLNSILGQNGTIPLRNQKLQPKIHLSMHLQNVLITSDIFSTKRFLPCLGIWLFFDQFINLFLGGTSRIS